MLFLTFAYPPSRQPRAIQISRIVAELKNHDITILAGDDEDKPDFTPIPSHAKVYRVTPSCLTQFFQRCRGDVLKRTLLPDLYYFWSRDLYHFANQHIKNHDSFMTFGMPMSVHRAGLRVKKENPHKRWIAHFSDPWLDNPYVPMNSWVHFCNQRAQDKVLSYADQLVFTSEETVDVCLKDYPEAIKEKASVIPHSFDPDIFPKRTRKDDDFFIIRHIGHFYGPRKPDAFLRAIQQLKQQNRWPDYVRVEFIGAKAPEGFSDSHISFLPSVSYAHSLQVMVDSDLLLLIDADMDHSVFFLSKLVDYMGAERPIFGIVPEGACRRILTDLKCFIAHPQNKEEIVEVLYTAITKATLPNQKAAHNYRAKDVAKIFESQIFENSSSGQN